MHRFIKGVGGRPSRLRLKLHTVPPSRASHHVHTLYAPLLSRSLPPRGFDSAQVCPIARLHGAEVTRWLPRCRYYRARRGEGLAGRLGQARGRGVKGHGEEVVEEEEVQERATQQRSRVHR